MSKELQKFDRAEIEYKEKEKHIQAKQKKLSKALQQDLHQKSESQTWLDNFESDVSSAEKNLEQLMASLEKEETKLNNIRESLKGKSYLNDDHF